MNKLATLFLLLSLAVSQATWSMDFDPSSVSEKSGIKKGYVQTSEGQLFYRDSGETGPVLLCIHGNSTDGRLFKQLRKTNSSLRFVSFDSPGHGKSFRASGDAAKEIYSFPGCAKMLLEGLDQLNIEKFSILGVSKGGHEAINLYAQAPDRIQALFLSGMPPLPLFENGEHMQTILSRAFKPSEASSLMSKAESFNEADARTYLMANGFSEPSEKMLQTAMKTDGQARSLMFEAALAGKRVDEIQTLLSAQSSVVLFVSGEDAFISEPYLESLKQILPNVTFESQSQGDHALVWKEAKYVNDILEKVIFASKH